MSRRGCRGQALIETAITLPVLLALFLGFLAAGVAAQAIVDLHTAVYLAAASNVTAYASDQPLAMQYATETYNATVSHDTLIVSRSFACPPANGQDGGYGAGQRVTCTGTADLLFSRTPLGVVFPDIHISAQASATRSAFRSCDPNAVVQC